MRMRRPSGRTSESAHALAAVVVARRHQMRVRLGLCFANALVFHALSGVAAAALWAAGYALVQFAEAYLFADVVAETVFSPRRRVAYLAILTLSNAAFAFFGILEAFHYGVWGLLGAGLLWSGALLNGALLSGESRQALAASIAPPVLAFLTAPYFVVADGGTLWLGLAMLAAGAQNGLAAVSVWAASRRLLSAAARATESARLARIDSETGLPNRYALQARIAALKLEAGEGGVVVAAIGLDRFEALQNAIGHASTVGLIRAVASRLDAAFPQAATARLSSNVLGAAWIARDADDARRAMLKLHQAMETPIQLGETPIDVSVTIGASEAAEPAAADIAIVDRAILAIEHGRRNRQPVTRFEAGLHDNPIASLSLMSEMVHAIDCDEMGVHYQPKLDLARGAFVGVEALVRWSHPRQGPLAAGAFLLMAEETGRIGALTEWVLKRAVEDQRRLLDLGHRLCFSVNLSGRLLDDEDFADTILRIAGRSVGKIILEVTETAIIGNSRVAYRTLEAFRAADIGISIDDYGAGLSSLGYLKNIPADELKVDRMFILNVAQDRTDEMLVRSAIELGHNLGLQVVAEGVETEGALDLLASMGCDLAQGYFIARPMALVDLEGLLPRRSAARPRVRRKVA